MAFIKAFQKQTLHSGLVLSLVATSSTWDLSAGLWYYLSLFHLVSISWRYHIVTVTIETESYSTDRRRCCHQFSGQVCWEICMPIIINIIYRQDLPQAALPVLFLLTGQFLGFPRWTDPGQIWQGGSFLPNFSLIGPGVGVYGPQNWKNWNFTNIIVRKRRLPWRFSENLQVLCASTVYIILPNLAALFR